MNTAVPTRCFARRSGEEPHGFWHPFLRTTARRSARLGRGFDGGRERLFEAGA
jgi:hypothetical protein